MTERSDYFLIYEQHLKYDAVLEGFQSMCIFMKEKQICKDVIVVKNWYCFVVDHILTSDVFEYDRKRNAIVKCQVILMDK